MAQLAMRISVLRGQDNERLQDIIVANETDDMEFYIENGMFKCICTFIIRLTWFLRFYWLQPLFIWRPPITGYVELY